MAYISERLYGTLEHLLAFLSWVKRLYGMWEKKNDHLNLQRHQIGSSFCFCGVRSGMLWMQMWCLDARKALNCICLMWIKQSICYSASADLLCWVFPSTVLSELICHVNTLWLYFELQTLSHQLKNNGAVTTHSEVSYIDFVCLAS